MAVKYDSNEMGNALQLKSNALWRRRSWRI